MVVSAEKVMYYN